MNYEDRYRGKCLVSVFRGELTGKIMYVMPHNSPSFFRVIVGNKSAETTSYEDAFDLLTVL